MTRRGTTGGQGVGAPAERADDVAKAAYGVEGGVQHRAAHGVVDDVEALAAGMCRDIGRDLGVAIDPGGAEAFDQRPVAG